MKKSNTWKKMISTNKEIVEFKRSIKLEQNRWQKSIERNIPELCKNVNVTEDIAGDIFQLLISQSIEEGGKEYYEKTLERSNKIWQILVEAKRIIAKLIIDLEYY